MILIVGGVRAWLEAGRQLPQLDRTHYADLADLSARLLDRLRPDIVISPLFGPGFDAIDVALALERLGFSGQFRAVTPDLPQPSLVRREIASLAPGLDFDILVLDASTRF